jgi:oxygen-independent coproporphyrinogen-3 oxidase
MSAHVSTCDPRPTVGLYVHVPFCRSKCGYCDFYSRVAAPGAFEPYIEALVAELDMAVAQRGLRVDTIFIGGGTPTCLPVEPLGRLLGRLGEIARRDDCREFTVEANPATIDDAKAALMKSCGVDRVSMGAQSFNAGELAVLDREHSPADVAASIEILNHAGLARYNLDLIFGVPGQTLDSWASSLRAAIDLRPEHLSCYGLTYEPGTRLHDRLQNGRVSHIAEDIEADMYLATMDTLETAGYRQYEISNYARPGCECRHNLRYWRNLPGIGIGPSAASYYQHRRWRNVPDTASYVQAISAGKLPVIDLEELSPLDRAGETAMLALRLVEGIDCRQFREATGLDPLELFAAPIQAHASAGLLVVREGHLSLTRKGRLVGDAIIADFLSPSLPEGASHAADHPGTHF